MNRWVDIPNSELKCFYLDKHRYRGPNRQLEGGLILEEGDLVIEIHLNNKRMGAVGSSIKRIFKVIDTELKALAWTLENDPKYRDIVAIYGRTVLYPITEKKGFVSYEIEKRSMVRFLKVWDNLIKYAYEDRQHKGIRFREPKEIWITREKLITDYINR